MQVCGAWTLRLQRHCGNSRSSKARNTQQWAYNFFKTPVLFSKIKCILHPTLQYILVCFPIKRTLLFFRVKTNGLGPLCPMWELLVTSGDVNKLKLTTMKNSDPQLHISRVQQLNVTNGYHIGQYRYRTFPWLKKVLSDNTGQGRDSQIPLH